MLFVLPIAYGLRPATRLDAEFSAHNVLMFLELKCIMIGALSVCCLGDLVQLTSSKDQMSRSRRLDWVNI